jgi:hypothetical protein
MLRYFDKMAGPRPEPAEAPEAAEAEEPAPIESADAVPPIEAPAGVEPSEVERELAAQRAHELDRGSPDT